MFAAAYSCTVRRVTWLNGCCSLTLPYLPQLVGWNRFFFAHHVYYCILPVEELRSYYINVQCIFQSLSTNLVAALLLEVSNAISSLAKNIIVWNVALPPSVFKVVFFLLFINRALWSENRPSIPSSASSRREPRGSPVSQALARSAGAILVATSLASDAQFSILSVSSAGFHSFATTHHILVGCVIATLRGRASWCLKLATPYLVFLA